VNRILVIAYAFPPCGGAGVQRTAKFVHYLPAFGWLPTVVTVVPSCYGVTDSSQDKPLPDEVEIIRTMHFDPVARFTRPSTTANQNGFNGTHSNARSSFTKALRSVARNTWVAFDRNALIPDQAITWVPRALAAGLAAHRRHRFDLIYATGEPYSDYFTASTLSRITGVPFVLDMRDPWTLASYRSEVHSAARQSIERWQERGVLAKSSACVFANRAVDLYSEAFPQWANKFHYIPNGYDPADFEGVEPKQFDRFTIVHSGTFLPGYRTADTFLLALRELLNAQPNLSNRISVQFVGKIGEEQELIRELSLDDVVTETGYLPHKESIGYLKGADLLLLVGGRHQWEETGKVYEYLATGKPILALVHPEGGAAELLRLNPAARIVDRESLGETCAALADAISVERTGQPAPDTTGTEQYERKRLTEKLATLFDNCTATTK
jgi:glycosyltransferase involved in cell wall biosynthesis